MLQNVINADKIEQVVPFLATKRVGDGGSLTKKKNMKPSV